MHTTGIPKPEFDEYRTAIDENELIIRVTKNTRTVCKISNHPEIDLKKCVEGDTNPEEVIQVSNKHLCRRFSYPKQYAMTVKDDGNDVRTLIKQIKLVKYFIHLYLYR